MCRGIRRRDISRSPRLAALQERICRLFWAQSPLPGVSRVPALKQVLSLCSAIPSQTSRCLEQGCPQTWFVGQSLQAHTPRGRLSHATSHAAWLCQGSSDLAPGPASALPTPCSSLLLLFPALSPGVLVSIPRWHRSKSCFSSHSVSQRLSQDAVCLPGAVNS